VGVLKGEAPITYTEASGTKSQSFTCPDGSDGGWTETDTITGSTPGTANVLRLSLPDLSQIAGPGADLTVHLLIDPGMPREILSADREPQCGEGANTSAPVDFWYGDFVSTPLTGQSPGTAASEVPFGETLATDFTLQLDNGNPEVAHAVYSGSTTGDDGDDVTEQTTIDIVHTPPLP
jgi:hypothetical protein